MNIYGNCCGPSSGFTNFTKDDLNPIDMEIMTKDKIEKICFQPDLNYGIFTKANEISDNIKNKLNEEIEDLIEKEKSNNEKIRDLNQKIQLINKKISSMNEMLQIDMCEQDYIEDFGKKILNKSKLTQSYYEN